MSAARPLALGLLAALCVGRPAAARADEQGEEAPLGEKVPTISDFWKRSPTKAQDRALERRFYDALSKLRQGMGSGDRRLVINRTSVRLGHLILSVLLTQQPRSVRFWYWYGYSAMLLQQPDVMIRAWTRVWKLNPYHWDTPNMAFELGIAYAKRGQYAESMAVYRKGMPATHHLQTRGIMASNGAESVMALGKLSQAVALYRKSLRLRPRTNSAAWWGLMVAYDRMGRTAAADRALRQGLLLDPLLQGLTGQGVFFVPQGDVHNYLALVYEGQGRIRDALRQWNRFLLAQPARRWSKRAREHRDRLQQIVARFVPVVRLVATRPHRAHPTAAQLVPLLQACYSRRARAKPVPEGQLPIFLTLQNRRVVALRFGWSPRPVYDHALRRCIRQRLQNRRIPAAARARIVAVFQLELSP
ncbi:MAG: tetratricopeptide repeat protein [bacterium]